MNNIHVPFARPHPRQYILSWNSVGFPITSIDPPLHTFAKCLIVKWHDWGEAGGPLDMTTHYGTTTLLATSTVNEAVLSIPMSRPQTAICV